MPTKLLLQCIAIYWIAIANHAVAASPAELRNHLVIQAPPATSVNSVAVSPDGSLVATAAGEGGVRVYDAQSGELLRVLGDIGDRSVVFSPDGRTVAAAGFHMDELVKLCDVRTGRILRTFAGHSQIETCASAFSPDGKLLASAGRDSEILVWDVATGTLRYRIDGAPAIALAFSPDGKILASGGCDKTVRLWNAITGELQNALTGHSDCVVTLAFSPDGSTIASGSCDWANHRGRNTAYFAWHDPGCLSEWKLWDAATGEAKRTVTVPGRLLSLAFAPDGKSLACGIAREVRLYDPERETVGRVLASHDFDVTSVAFTPDGTAIFSGSHDQTLKRTSLATGDAQWRAPGHFEQVNSVALSRDGSLLVTGSSDGRYAVRVLPANAAGIGAGAVRLWDARTSRLVRRLGDPTEQVMAVAISPDGMRVASGGARARGTGVVRLYEAATGAVVWSLDDHTSDVLAVAFAPNGASLASGSADGLVRLRDARAGTVVRDLPGHEGGATSLAFSPDGATLICGEGQGATRVWDVSTGRLLHTCRSAQSRASTVTTDRLITSVVFSPDGTSFFAGTASVGNTYGEPVRLWDAQTGELKHEFEGRRPIALSPDGAILATGGKAIVLRDVPTGERARKLFGYLKKTQSIAFSQDGRLIFSGGSWGTTNVWEVATGRHLVTLFAFSPTEGGKASDDWLAYTPDGFYEGSPGIEQYLAWRAGDELLTAETHGGQRRRHDRVKAALTHQTPTPDLVNQAGLQAVSDAPDVSDRPALVPAPGSPVAVAGGALAAGDVNGNGFADLLLIAEQRLNIYFGAANRTWQKDPDASVDLGADASELLLADLNQDGHQDLVIADHDSDAVAVWLGSGDGRFAAADGSPFVAREGDRPHTHGLAVADVNGDGELDIVTANNEAGNVSLLLGDGAGKFVRATGSPFPCGKKPYPIAAADVNGDRCADVLVPNAVPDSDIKTLTVLLGSSPGELTAAPNSPLLADATVWYAAAGDLNGDNWPDVVATHNEGYTGANVWLNTGDGEFMQAPGSPLQFGHGAWGVEIADMDVDGNADLVVAADESIRVLLGDGTGRLAAAEGSPFKTGKGAWRLVVADFNGDGRPDVATRCVEANQLEILLGN